MNDMRDIRPDLEPGTPEELIVLAQRLQHERPVPSAAFRGDLRRHLLPGELARSPGARARLWIAGFASAGSVLLLAGAASVVGIGPLGA